MHKCARTIIGLLMVTGPIVGTASADGSSSYHVTITNLTNSITFTPILVASHRRDIALFSLGSPTSDELTAIAEDGNVGPLTDLLKANRRVVEVQDSGALLAPGASVTLVVSARHGARLISLASMMLPTNDGFIALDSVKAPRHGSLTYFSPGYDAGSEANDESCANIPGPTCGGVGPSPNVTPGVNNAGDEGYTHIHRGIHGIEDLAADVYDWRNPVAKITVTRIRADDEDEDDD